MAPHHRNNKQAFEYRKKQSKLNSTIHHRNTAIAKKKRDQMMRSRMSNQNLNTSNTEKFVPKSLRNVQGVYKNKIQIDREIGRRRKMRNQNMDKEPQIYAPSPPKQKQSQIKTPTAPQQIPRGRPQSSYSPL